MSISLSLLLTGLLVLANAFFVASEFAVVKMRPTRIKELVGQGRRRARLLASITRRLDSFLSANQLGVTLCSLALGWIGEPAVAHVLEPRLLSLGSWTGFATRTLALGISFSAIAFVHTVVGELVPKCLALQLTEPVALWSAAPLRVFHVLAFPMIWALNKSANLLLRVMGLRAPSDAEMLHSPNELRMVLQHVKLDPGARRLIDRVFDYTHRVARHVMILRRDVVALVADRPFEDNLKIALANQYTRYPLVEPASDRVIGYVHLKDIMGALASGRPPAKMRDLLREPIYCPGGTHLEWLRREFQRRRVHIAIVQGPAETFLGIVTMEDLLEEFVGEIQDEQDIGEIPPIVHAAGGRFEADGRVTLDVAARDLNIKVAAEVSDSETLGNYVESHLGKPPLPGDSVVIDNVCFTALEIRDGHIWRLRGEPVATAES